MKIKIENMKIKQDLTKQGVLDFACKKMRIKHDLVEDFQILKKSIDARNKNDIFYNNFPIFSIKLIKYAENMQILLILHILIIIPHNLSHPSATSKTIIRAKPTATPIVTRFDFLPDCASGISSEATT